MTPELFSAPWFSALASIIVIDLILAGDNAIVIGLAARNVPAAMQKRVILWGTVGAIIVRALLTAVVVWLLKIPGFLLSAAWRSSMSAGSSRTTAAIRTKPAVAAKSIGPRRRADDRHRRRRDGRRQRARCRRRGARLAAAGADRARRVDPDRDLGLDARAEVGGALSGDSLARRGRARLDGGEDDRERAAARRISARAPLVAHGAVCGHRRRTGRPRRCAGCSSRHIGFSWRRSTSSSRGSSCSAGSTSGSVPKDRPRRCVAMGREHRRLHSLDRVDPDRHRDAALVRRARDGARATPR